MERAKLLRFLSFPLKCRDQSIINYNSTIKMEAVGSSETLISIYQIITFDNAVIGILIAVRTLDLIL